SARRRRWWPGVLHRGFLRRRFSHHRRRPASRTPVPGAESFRSAFDLAADKLLDPLACNIVGNLARRMLHRVGRDRVERAADLAVAREPQAAYPVDHHPARIGRILHRHPKLELDRDTGKTFALDAQEADLVIALPGDEVGR